DTNEQVENMNEEAAMNREQDQQPVSDQETDKETKDEDLAAKLKEELEASKDKYIRLYSEFENFRRRTAKEKLELIQSANEQLITSLLPVADDFDRAQVALQDNKSSEIEGFFLIYSKFKKTLETYGVKPMDTARGSEFDADFHEAVSQIPAPEPDLKGKVVDVVEKGYMLNDKVIRYAK